MAKKQVPERKQFNNPNVVGLRAEVLEQPITETLERNYMPYAMSVIISRAIPEIDGFKPSHRKLLYTMYKMGLLSGACAHVECEFAPAYAELVAVGQHLVGEVQSCRGCCHAAVDVTIHGLVVGGVACLGFTVEVWRNWDFAYAVEDGSKGDVAAVPRKGYFP